LISPSGRLACVVENGDQGEGVAYFDVVDALTPHFSKVRMFGQTPFHAYGIAEFDEAAADLRMDAELVETQPEPSHYIAMGGSDEALSLGYALVQIPAPEGQGTIRENAVERSPVAAPAAVSDAAVTELRRKLTESEGKAEGLLRVSRAQSEEIEELRARLRRTAEARAELDEEVRRLRHSLIEADESVLSLTRKTTEEMTALAQRLTAGLRNDGPVTSPAMVEQLRRRESELAQRESALSERDDRVASLEVAKQEALWRVDAADDELARVRAELVAVRSELAGAQSELAGAQSELAGARSELAGARSELVGARSELVGARSGFAGARSELAGTRSELVGARSELVGARSELVAVRSELAGARSELAIAQKKQAGQVGVADDVAARLKGQAATIEEFRRAAAAHVDEVNRLRDAGNEQASLVTELEDELRGCEKRLADKVAEAAQLQKMLTEVEDAERLRRSRLAELEGFMLRAEYASARQNESRDKDRAELDDLSVRLRSSQSEAEQLRVRLAEVERAVAEAAVALRHDGRVAELEAELKAYQDRDQRLAELRADAPDPDEAYERLFDLETQYQAATMAAARVPELEAMISELQARIASAR
jgi:chromosome segregation ATPase